MINEAHIRLKSSGTIVRIICSPAFARKTSFGDTGNDCRIQMFFPSSDMEGTAMMIIPAKVQNDVHRITVVLFGISAKTISST